MQEQIKWLRDLYDRYWALGVEMERETAGVPGGVDGSAYKIFSLSARMLRETADMLELNSGMAEPTEEQLKEVVNAEV